MSALGDELAAIASDPLSEEGMIAELEARGFLVTADMPERRKVVNLSRQVSGTIRFGVVSDTHLGHKHQQLTHLRDFYRQAGEWGAEFMLHAGDLVDGQNMHRDQQFELFRHGVDSQAKYAIENLPRLAGSPATTVRRRGGGPKVRVSEPLPQYIIGGNHDGSGWNDVGANVLGQLRDNRPDINYLGAVVGDFNHGPLKIRMVHPSGGAPYARSYRCQKLVESFSPDEKPHILLVGHLHFFCHVSTRNVEAFQLPCFQSQTTYMKGKALAPDVGGVLFEVTYNELGPLDITSKFVRYSTHLSGDWP